MIRRKYVLRYGMTNTYIGEARDICTYNGVDDYVRVGDYIIVDSLAEAIPFTKKKAKELLKSSFADKSYTDKIGGELHALAYCGE